MKNDGSVEEDPSRKGHGVFLQGARSVYPSLRCKNRGYFRGSVAEAPDVTSLLCSFSYETIHRPNEDGTSVATK